MSLPETCKVRFVEPGTADSFLRECISSNGFRRALIVTGMKSFSWFEDRRFVPSLAATISVQHWAGVSPNPNIDDLRKLLVTAREFNPDVIVGIGGGSVIDMAKLVAGLADEPTKLDQVLASAQLIDSRERALVLVPTTAGSGAEATHFAVIYQRGVKYSVSGKGLVADYAVLDPDLVSSGASEQLAASGLDAFSQCIESLWSRRATSVSREKAEDGLRLVVPNLVAFTHGDTSKAAQMQRGSHFSGQAINISRTTGPHALSYYLTMTYGVPHGIAAASTVGFFIDRHNEMLRQELSPPLDGLTSSMASINRILGIGEVGSGTDYFNRLFDSLGLAAPDSYWPRSTSERETWLRSANAERLRNHPTEFPASMPTA